MANKMLIDATHPEETRVVVLRGNRVEEFDFESANRRQLRGNIYLAKVTRVEPSLQAAFVDYGGNRHGFLAFSEIHPDYYQIPVADRQALIAEEERAHRAAEDEVDRRAGRRGEHRTAYRRDEARHAPVEPVMDEAGDADEAGEAPPATDHDAAPVPSAEDQPAGEPDAFMEALLGTRADLSGLVVPRRRRVRRATKPCSRISAATVFVETRQPSTRRSGVIRGEP